MDTIKGYTEEAYPEAAFIAKQFHIYYESLAHLHGYETSAKDWSDIPEHNKSLMIHVVDALINGGFITNE